MTRSEHILIIGAGQHMPALLRAYRPGTRTSVITDLASLGEVQDPGGHARVIGLRQDADVREWIEAASGVHKADPVTRLATFGESGQARTAAIGAVIGLPFCDAKTVASIRDKSQMRQVLEQAGVERVRWHIAHSAGDLADWLNGNRGRWIIKPIDGGASAGVSAVTGPDDAEAAYQRCVSAQHVGRSGNPDVLVEEYLPGIQVSAEALSDGDDHCVVAVTKKFSDPRTFVELGHLIPAELPAQQRQRIEEHVKSVLLALGVRSGVTHTELVIGESSVCTIETHMRLAGAEIPAMVKAATGVDFIECLVRQTFGEPILPWVRSLLAGQAGSSQAVWFGVAPCDGLLVDVTGVEAAMAVHPSVRIIRKIENGEPVTELADSYSRVFLARAEGEDASTAVRRAYDAVACCSVLVSAPSALPGGFAAALL